jgi:hypothetical protein
MRSELLRKRFVTGVRCMIPVMLFLSLMACAGNPPPTIVTPQGMAAWVAAPIAEKVNELMDTAIVADANSGLPRNTVRAIITFCVEADKVLKDIPTGWQVTVQNLWFRLKDNEYVKPYLTSTVIKAVVAAVDALIGGV